MWNGGLKETYTRQISLRPPFHIWSYHIDAKVSVKLPGTGFKLN